MIPLLKALLTAQIDLAPVASPPGLLYTLAICNSASLSVVSIGAL